MSFVTAQQATAFTAHAFYLPGKGTAHPMHVEMRQQFATEAEAAAFAAHFPKAHKVRHNEVCCAPGTANYWVASVTINLAPTQGNDRNETGIKRYHAIIAKAAKLGLPTAFERPSATNAYPDRETFESAIG